VRILLTNDDGIGADGLRALEEVFGSAGTEVWVMAPAEEQSGTSHAVTLRKPLYINDEGPKRYSITGTPADAVNIGVNRVMKGVRPDLVVSGVNRGANLGCDVHYSGTAAAAREGALLGIDSIAVSLDTRLDRPDFGFSARLALRLSELIHATTLPPRTFINVNVPRLAEAEIKGVKVTTMGVRQYDNVVREEEGEDGAVGYSIGGEPLGGAPIPDSDIIAVEDGYVSITPLRLDLTNDCAMEWLQSKLDGGGRLMDDG